MSKRIIIAILLTALGCGGVSAQTERLVNTRDMYPGASPDDAQLVFQSNRNGKDQVFVLDMDDGAIRQLTDLPGGAESPVFSPDGKSIVFAAYVGEGNNDVFVMNADGSGIRQLTDGPGYDGHPHWSADGGRVVFNSDRTSPDPDASWSERWHEIFSVKTDGSDIRQHTRCKAVCTYGSLSPDGKKVLYRKVIRAAGFNWGLSGIEKNSEIFIADADGGNEVNLSNNAAFDGWPVWSPDGSQVAFASNRSGPANTGQVWLMNPDGSDLRQISFGPWSHAQPAWAFDGRSIYAYQLEETPEYEFGSVVRIRLNDRALER
jgi:Tol biopolymer transport system component